MPYFEKSLQESCLSLNHVASMTAKAPLVFLSSLSSHFVDTTGWSRCEEDIVMKSSGSVAFTQTPFERVGEEDCVTSPKERRQANLKGRGRGKDVGKLVKTKVKKVTRHCCGFFIISIQKPLYFVGTIITWQVHFLKGFYRCNTFPPPLLGLVWPPQHKAQDSSRSLVPKSMFVLLIKITCILAYLCIFWAALR